MFHAPFSQEISCANNRLAGVSYQMLWLLISSSSLTCLSLNRQIIFRVSCRVLRNNILQHRKAQTVIFFPVVPILEIQIPLNHALVSDTEIPLPLYASLVEAAAEISELLVQQP